MGLHFLPFTVFHAEAEFEERVAFDHFSLHFVALSGQSVAFGLQAVGNAAKVFVVGMQENERFGFLAQIVVEFAFGVHHAFKGTETLQMRFAHIGDQSAVGVDDF